MVHSGLFYTHATLVGHTPLALRFTLPALYFTVALHAATRTHTTTRTHTHQHLPRHHALNTVTPFATHAPFCLRFFSRVLPRAGLSRITVYCLLRTDAVRHTPHSQFTRSPAFVAHHHTATYAPGTPYRFTVVIHGLHHVYVPRFTHTHRFSLTQFSLYGSTGPFAPGSPHLPYGHRCGSDCPAVIRCHTFTHGFAAHATLHTHLLPYTRFPALRTSFVRPVHGCCSPRGHVPGSTPAWTHTHAGLVRYTPLRTPLVSHLAGHCYFCPRFAPPLRTLLRGSTHLFMPCSLRIRFARFAHCCCYCLLPLAGHHPGLPFCIPHLHTVPRITRTFYATFPSCPRYSPAHGYPLTRFYMRTRTHTHAHTVADALPVYTHPAPRIHTLHLPAHTTLGRLLPRSCRTYTDTFYNAVTILPPPRANTTHATLPHPLTLHGCRFKHTACPTPPDAHSTAVYTPLPFAAPLWFISTLRSAVSHFYRHSCPTLNCLLTFTVVELPSLTGYRTRFNTWAFHHSTVRLCPNCCRTSCRVSRGPVYFVTAHYLQRTALTFGGFLSATTTHVLTPARVRLPADTFHPCYPRLTYYIRVPGFCPRSCAYGLHSFLHVCGRVTFMVGVLATHGSCRLLPPGFTFLRFTVVRARAYCQFTTAGFIAWTHYFEFTFVGFLFYKVTGLFTALPNASPPVRA